VEATTTGGQKVIFTYTQSGFVSPTGFQTYTLTVPSSTPVTYQITDGGGDYTQFTEPSGASAYMPTTVAQASGAGGLNRVTYVLKEGRTAAIIGPEPAGVSCPAAALESKELERGCRALWLKYTSKEGTTAGGEAESEWGDYEGRIASVTFVAWDPTSKKMREVPVARYAYDAQGRLRAAWDPRISPNLKTTYGYDGEAHLTALSLPGQQPFLLNYGVTATDPSRTRLLAVTRPPSHDCTWERERSSEHRGAKTLYDGSRGGYDREGLEQW